jgi:hypothetical protein
MFQNTSISPASTLRAQYATSLCLALGDAHPVDAACICLAFLEDQMTDGPVTDPFGNVLADARFWADVAPPHEVVAYGTAALLALQKSALGSRTRKNLFVKLWESFPTSDRVAFLSKVDCEGRFLRKVAL